MCSTKFATVSSGFSRQPQVEKGSVQRMIDDYLFFTQERTTFSLSTTGYQPLGVSQLGGPANPEDTPVMQVRTSGRTLLRGSIKNEYNGRFWSDSTQNRRYLYVNPRFYALRRNLFDQNRPTDSLRAELPDSEPITVLMRADATSTLYLTQRFSALSGDEIVPYFSPASEVFGTRSLAFGDVYTFSGQRLSGDTSGLREIVLAAAQTPDAAIHKTRSRSQASIVTSPPTFRSPCSSSGRIPVPPAPPRARQYAAPRPPSPAV